MSLVVVGLDLKMLSRSHNLEPKIRFEWANQEQITLLYIQPGKPIQNGYVERFNRTARNEWLELNLYEDIERAQLLASQWQWTYNNERPHSSIGGVPPRQLL